MELWANGKYFPVFYSREKIETVIEKKTVLAPSSYYAVNSVGWALPTFLYFLCFYEILCSNSPPLT